MLKIFDFAIDHVKEPMIMRCDAPRFSWKLKSDNNNILQVAYRIILDGDNGEHFDSGVVQCSSVTGHTIAGMILTSKTNYAITIQVWDNTNETASYTVTVPTEILSSEWGDAKWIRPAEHIAGWAPYLRTKFSVCDIKEAVLYASGLGCAEIYINGKRTDDAYVEPPASNYEKTVYYRRWNVTELIKDGGNAMAIWLGQGFYAQDRVWEDQGIGLAYGKECAIARLEISMKDGSQKVIVTDTEHWKAKYSPISLNNYYGGETYDGRIETHDFASYESSENGWMSVVEDETHKGELTTCLIPAVRVIRKLPAISVHGVSGESDGTWVFDIGENIAGIAEFRLPPSPRGAIYVFRYGEVLNEQGGVDLRSTGVFATQCIPQDIYICRGDKNGEIYCPRFCYHGFRYVEISGIFDYSEGYGMTPKLDMVCGLQLSTAFEKSGNFSCKHQDWNRLYQIMDNTYRSNYHGFPEDCPVREKCGWLGDAQIVSDFGLLTYDSTASYIKYLHDIRTSKELYEGWRLIAPGKRRGDFATPLWGCAQIVIPYNIWRYKGDEQVIRDNFDLMEEWVANELARSKNYVISEGLGDWEPPGSVGNPRRMPVEHSSTFMFYEISKIMEELCLEFKMGNASYYGKLANNIKEVILERFYDKDKHSFGYLGSDSVAIQLNLLTPQEKELHIRQLLENLETTHYEMPTGIYGNKYLVPAMLELGLDSQVTEVLFGKSHDSFGTMLEAGATTIWECPSMKIVAGRSAGCVASYNHPMHGGFLYTCYTHLAGIRPYSPGFSIIEFAPVLAKEIGDVSATLDTPYGEVSVDIREVEKGYVCSVEIPAGARVKICNRKDYTILINGDIYDIEKLLGSGLYVLTYIRKECHV